MLHLRNMIVFMVALVLAGGVYAGNDVTMEDLQFDGMTVVVKSTGQKFDIEPLKSKQAEGKFKLEVVQPTWRLGKHLPYVSWTYAAMTPGSLQISAADNGQVFEEGKDYVVCDAWGTVGATKNGGIKAGKEMKFAFSYTASRIDLVQQDSQGKLSLVKGVEDRRVPEVPQASKGCKAVFSIYLPHNTTAISKANINIIKGDGKLVAPVLRKERISKIVTDMEAGKPTTIVFLGDSITAQNDVEGGSFVDLFYDYLATRYADRKVTMTPRNKVVPANENEIVVVKAGVGGNNTRQGLARIESDVLAHEPELVFIMFGANDENGPVGGPTEVSLEDYRLNLTKMVKMIRAAGGEPAIVTPGMKNLNWAATSGQMTQYAEMAKQAGAEMDVCVIDVHDSWQRIPTVGSNYMIYLSSCINHPNHLGHGLFFEGLKAAVE